MKRNESVLVYSVTGLLLVILGIAVLFGDGGPTPSTPTPESTGVAMQPIVPATDPVLEKFLRPVDEPEVAPQDAAPISPPADEAAGDGAAPQGPAPAEGATGTKPVPLNAGSPMEAMLRSVGVSAIGETERQGDYRRVRVRSGDDLGRILQTWGAAEQRDLVLTINEEIARRPDRLRVGEWIVLPWVDDSVVLERYLQKLAEGKDPAAPMRGAHPAGQPETTPAAPADGTWYTIRAGDKLWTIASARVTTRRASEYVERIVAANPGLDPGRIREGQKILLPTAQQ